MEIDVQQVAKRILEKRIDEWNKNKKLPLDLTNIQLKKYEGIPNGVTHLICNNNKTLITLEGLPNSIKRLDYRQYPLKELSNLPENLEYLQCDSSKIEILDNLPNSIKKIKMTYYPHLRMIKTLPYNLKELNLNLASELVEIQCEFPQTLRYLNLCMAKIGKLPLLPDSLTKLDISMTNHITSIHTFPKCLKVLTMFGTNLKNIPKLPNSLLFLRIDSIHQLEKKILPNSIKYFESNEYRIEDKIYRNFF